MKIREFKDCNYRAIFSNGKTFRFAVDPSKPVLPLKFEEFQDVKLTNFCNGACKYCYQDSTKKGKHGVNIIKRIEDFYGPLTENERPFQVALGGGEPTTHPEFIDVLNKFDSLGIMPNYTTNGMFIAGDQFEVTRLMEATKELCGGVAISCHEHLQKYWKEAIKKFTEYKIKLNLHIIISDKQSVLDFRKIFDEYEDLVDYFVLLPYQAMGRAKEKKIDFESLKKHAPSNVDKIAFGADFYKFLVESPGPYKVSLYEPEIFSGYVDFSESDGRPKIYKSSFDLTEKQKD